MLDFYRGRRVLITGHTGFKGTWLTKILVNAGANVVGYSRGSVKKPNFYALSRVGNNIESIFADIRDIGELDSIFKLYKPEIVFHLAAQPLVRKSYEKPLETYETNIMGTANVLECVRKRDSVRSVVIITTDKVYKNEEQEKAFCEEDVLDGYDPYSNSKSCAELITAAYRRSFPDLPPISTTRAGNVIGGGDFARDRIIPDCVRAAGNGEKIIVRNPYSIRPYQHVLEPLFAYLLIAEKQYGNPAFSGSYNIGPDDGDCITTGELVNLFCEKWGDSASWESKSEDNAPHEAGFLKLDCSLMKKTFGWKPKWHIDGCMNKVITFNKLHMAGYDIASEMDHEIQEYLDS